MSRIYDFVDDVNQKFERFINENSECNITADKLGLDKRAGYNLFVTDDSIIVSKNDDRTLQYYGGFEYCDKEYRTEIGDYVIYLDSEDRVKECLDRYYDRAPADDSVRREMEETE